MHLTSNKDYHMSRLYTAQKSTPRQVLSTINADNLWWMSGVNIWEAVTNFINIIDLSSTETFSQNTVTLTSHVIWGISNLRQLIWNAYLIGVSSHQQGVSSQRLIGCWFNGFVMFTTEKNIKRRITEFLWGESTTGRGILAEDSHHKWPVIRKALPWHVVCMHNVHWSPVPCSALFSESYWNYLSGEWYDT